MILFIDTSDFNKIIFAAIGDRTIKKAYRIDPHESHKTMTALGKFLKLAGFKKEALEKIVICSGPGSYTGVRIGITTALALSLAWQVPAESLEKSKIPTNLAEIKKLRGKKINHHAI